MILFYFWVFRTQYVKQVGYLNGNAVVVALAESVCLGVLEHVAKTVIITGLKEEMTYLRT